MPIKAKVPYWFKMKQWNGADKITVVPKGQESEQSSPVEPKREQSKSDRSSTTNDQKIQEPKIEIVDMNKEQRDELVKALKIKVADKE